MEGQDKILWTFIATLFIFAITFVLQGNLEFIGSVVVIILLMIIVLASNQYVKYSNYVLWGLFAWGVLHMLGGIVLPDGSSVYSHVLFPLVGAPYNILKYDQIVHMYGSFMVSVVTFMMLKNYFADSFDWSAVGIIVVMIGLGFGTINEIIEFFLTVILPRTGVGGYENNVLDLVFNLLGAIAAIFFLRSRQGQND